MVHLLRVFMVVVGSFNVAVRFLRFRAAWNLGRSTELEILLPSTIVSFLILMVVWLVILA
jgi:hypothetical protein